MHFSQIKHMAILISVLIQYSASGYYFEAAFFIKHLNERSTTYRSVQSTIKVKFLLKNSFIGVSLVAQEIGALCS